MLKQKASKFLESYQRRGLVKPDHDQSAFFLALCHVQLGNYTEAQRLFEQSIQAMFIPPLLWHRSSQPNWLVDVCVLSGRTNHYRDAARKLDEYRSDRRGDSLVALYAYSMMEFLLPAGKDFSSWIEGLLKKPKIKDMYAMGLSIQAIVDGNDSKLQYALLALLEAHRGQAIHGGLRETAEGLLCMPAMSLSYAALERKMKVQIENDYLSLGYLKYLRTELPLKH